MNQRQRHALLNPIDTPDPSLVDWTAYITNELQPDGNELQVILMVDR